MAYVRWPPSGAQIPQAPEQFTPPEQHDHLWQVLHGRQGDDSPRQRRRISPQPPPPAHPAGMRRKGPDVRSAPQLPGVAYVQQLPPLPAPNYGDPSGQMRGGHLISDLKPKLSPLDAGPLGGPGPGDAAGWLERAEHSRRMEAFESGDRRFKDWVQREVDQFNTNLQQVKNAALDCQQRYQSQTEAMAPRLQKLELQIVDVQSSLAQVSSRAQAMHVANANGGESQAGLQASLDALRNDLNRESGARVAAVAETTSQIRELHNLLAQVNVKHEGALLRQQHITESPNRRPMHSAIDLSVDAFRSELEALREEIRRSVADSARRCEDVANMCSQRLSGVQDSALSAARELWEEHHTVVKDCKETLTSLQQILDTKDKIAEQRQSVQQQQREDDKQELLGHLQQNVNSICKRIVDIEGSLATEQGARAESQRQCEALVSRLGRALEQAQEAWLKEVEQLSLESPQGARRQPDSAADGATADADGNNPQSRPQEIERRLNELEARITAAKCDEERFELEARNVPVKSSEERLDDDEHVRVAELPEMEKRLRRAIEDEHTLQTAKVAQLEFDLRSVLRTSLDRETERWRLDFSQLRENFAQDRALVKGILVDNSKEIENRLKLAYTRLDKLEGNHQEITALETKQADGCKDEIIELRAQIEKLNIAQRNSEAEMSLRAKQADRCKNDIAELHVQMEKFSVAQGKSEAGLKSLETRIADQCKNAMAEFHTQIEKLNMAQGKSVAEMTAMEAKQADIAELRAKIEKLDLARVKSEVEMSALEAKQADRYNNEHSELRAQIEKLSMAQGKSVAEMAAMEAKLATIAELRAKIEKLDLAQVKSEVEMSAFEAKQADRYKNELSELRSQIEKLSAAQGKSEVDLTAFEDRLAEGYKQDMIEVRTQIEKLNVAQGRSIAEMTALETKQKDFLELRAQIDKLNMTQEKWEAEMTALEARQANLCENDIAELRSQIAKLNTGHETLEHSCSSNLKDLHAETARAMAAEDAFEKALQTERETAEAANGVLKSVFETHDEAWAKSHEQCKELRCRLDGLNFEKDASLAALREKLDSIEASHIELVRKQAGEQNAITTKIQDDVEQLQSAQAITRIEFIQVKESLERRVDSASKSTLALTKRLDKLRARVDGGFDAMLVRLETWQFTMGATNAAADNIHISFLKTLDSSIVKLEEHVHKIEERLRL